MKQDGTKFILITGGAKGIGLGITKKLSNNKCKIIVIDKDRKALSKLKGKLNILTKHVDLSSTQDINKFLIYLKKRRDIKISHLINNAGYQENVDILDLDISQWEKMLKVNLNACLLLSQHIAKEMIINEVNGGIINITSIHSQIIRDMAHYSSSKAALEMLTKEFAYKLARYNIRVNAIAPGSIETPMLCKDLNTATLLKKAASAVPLKRLGIPEDIANAVEFLISDKSKYITGTTITVDGGLSLII
jgi:3-oxoacyl-[acyl-carrier protein] reductase